MASDFKDAFLKAGVVTKERIEQQEQHEKQLEKEKKQQAEDALRKGQLEYDQQHNEYLTKIQPFESRWQNANSKNFIKHLLNAFLPFDKGQIIFDWSLITFQIKKCCICNLDLISKVDALAKLSEIGDAFVENLSAAVKEQGLEAGLTQVSKQTKQQIFGDKLLGIFSPDSNKLFCGDCYSIFTEWIQNKMFTDVIFAKYITSIRLRSMNVISRSN